MLLSPAVSFGIDLLSTAVEGHTQVYAASGTTANPTTLFVHGWASTHKYWKHALPHMGGRRRCVAPDLLGFGVSDKPPIPYTMEAHVGYLARFMDALGIDKTELVGHSMGGTISLLFALTHPDRVSKLVVVNPLVQGASAWTLRTRLLTFPILRALVFALSHVRPIRLWVAKDFTHVAPLEPELVDDVVAGTYHSTIQPILSMRDTDLAPRLGELRMPVLLVGTDLDLVIKLQRQR